MTQPMLSICIPTFRMAPYLRDLLGTIAEQSGDVPRDALEIVVCDNASPDDTKAVVDSFRERFGRFVYQRHTENIGPDRNFLAAVAAASGRYCWLMGSDDVVEPGAVAKLLRLIETYPDVCGMSLNRNARSFDLATIIPENAFPAIPHQRLLHGAETIFSALSYYFGYLSAQVIHRDTWQQVVRTQPIARYYNAYVHVFVIAEMLKLRPDWLVVVDRLVGWRSGNDSFMADGRYRRLEIDVVGYEQIAAGAFGKNSDTYRAMRDTIATQHLRHHIIAALGEGSWSPDLRRKTRRLAFRHYAASKPFWWQTAPLLIVPARLLVAAARARRQLKARNGD